MKESYILDVIVAFRHPFYEWMSIDTIRIDSHIRELNKMPWFQKLYQ